MTLHLDKLALSGHGAGVERAVVESCVWSQHSAVPPLSCTCVS